MKLDLIIDWMRRHLQFIDAFTVYALYLKT